MNDLVLLDTSAVFTLLADEPGANTVRKYIDTAARRAPRVLLSFVTLTEVRYVLMQEENGAAADHAVALIKSWPVEWVHSSEQLCLAAAELKAHHRISLADAFIAATALGYGAGLVHKDPEFEVLAGVIQLLPLPYKR